MRHGKRFNHLGRTAPHRKAMLSNMASSLIMHKRISTTVAKAKALRQYVEPLLTKAKNDTTHSRRIVFSYLQNKESLRELFDVVSEKISNRPGGYTRIIKTGTRLGDSAEMCIMELVDYNELLLEEKETKKTRTRRGSRRRKKSTAKEESAASVGVDQTVSAKEAVEEQQAEQEEKNPEAAQQEEPAAKAEQKAETEVAKEDDADKAAEDKKVKASKKEDADVPDKDPSGEEKKEDKGNSGDQDKK